MGLWKSFGGGVEQVGEELAAFAEDAAEHFREGEPSRPEASKTDWPEARPARAD